LLETGHFYSGMPNRRLCAPQQHDAHDAAVSQFTADTTPRPTKCRYPTDAPEASMIVSAHRYQGEMLIMKWLRGLTVCFAACLTPEAWGNDFDCLIEASQEVSVRSPVDAVIESIQVERGDTISKGQVLASMEAGPERAALDLAKSRATAQGELKVAETRVDLAAKKLARADELLKTNFVSQNARDETAADYRLAQEQVQTAKENLELASLDSKRAGQVLALRMIRSPLTGVVVDVLQRPGEFAGTTIHDPIMKIAQIDPLYVEVILPVSLYGSVKAGAKARVFPEAPVGGSYETTVKVVDRVVDAASGTFGVRLVLANTNHVVPAGVKCKVRF
jgi:RND family efflux transporter MFP subunit